MANNVVTMYRPYSVYCGNSTSGNTFITVSNGGKFGYGRSGQGHFVTLICFRMPTSVTGTVYQIGLGIYGSPFVGNGYKTQAKLAVDSMPASDTPAGWLNHSASSTSSECTGSNYGQNQDTYYWFSDGLGSIKAGSYVRIWVYGTTSSSYSEGVYGDTFPYIDIYCTDSASGAVAPTSVTRNTLYSGFYTTALSFTAKSNVAGHFFVTSSNPASSSTVWWRKDSSSTNTKSATFIVDKDTSTTSLSKTFYITCIPNNTNGSVTGAFQSYIKFNAPRFGFKLYANSSSAVDINSADFSTLPSSYNNPEGYTLHGYSDSANSTSISQTAGQAWYTTYNGSTKYAVYKKPSSTVNISLNANGGIISASSATKSTTEAWIFGRGQKSGGTATYSNESVIPTRTGYMFLEWKTSTLQTGVVYSSIRTALDAGYTGTLYAVWRQNRGVRIFDSSNSSSLYAAYIYNGTSWDYYIPYIYDGSSWQEMG